MLNFVFHQTIAVTNNKVVAHLDKHPFWPRLAVLTRFLLALSFNNKTNGESTQIFTIQLYIIIIDPFS